MIRPEVGRLKESFFMKSRHFFILGLALAAMGTALVGGLFLRTPYKLQGSLIDPPLPVGDFQLTDQYGQTFRLHDLLNSETEDIRAVMVFFGYVHCPDVCPLTLVEFKRVKAGLGDLADYVRFVFITVDPERDTPERLQRHLANYDPSFIGLTGEEQELQPVWDQFFVSRFRQEVGSASGYLVDHTTRIYVIDRDGNLGVTFGFGEGAEVMEQDLRHIVTRR
jgi:protein SCO1